jgi:HD superfamily phosphodiesterase
MDPELLDLLLALDGVVQSPRYHREGDALFHSLQVFDLARRATSDRELWAAALLHDVGKAFQDETSCHDEIGADLLDGLV